jgi:hypothetical protein
MIPVLVGAILVLAAVLALIVLARSERIAVTLVNRRSFAERFPPISDVEYLALCSPGVNPEVALKVRRIVANHFGIDYERVHPSMSFIDDMGAD